MSRLLSLVALVGAAILATGCGGGEEDKTIPVAIVGPITGQYASFGAQMKSGGGMAVADINEAGTAWRWSPAIIAPAPRSRPRKFMLRAT